MHRNWIPAAVAVAALLVPAASSSAPQTAPQNTGEPVVSGQTVQGETLTTTNGHWTGSAPLAFRYRWLRCDTSGGSCADISGATGSTYVLKDVDIGRTLRVRVTAHNSLGARAATSTPTGVVAKAGIASGNTISINEVALPNRLVIDRVQFSPFILRSHRSFTARFRVTDTQNHPVQGAMVFVVGIPFGNTTTPPEQATGADGYVTFVIRPTSRLPLSAHGNQPFFVRARKATDRLIAGVPTRRLVNLSIRAG